MGFFVARMEDTRLPKCVVFGDHLMGGADCVWGGAGEMRFLDDQWRLQPKTRGMAQDGGTRGRTFFHGEMGRCRESEGWTGIMQWYART